MKDLFLAEVKNVREFLIRSLSPLDEADSNFKPDDQIYTVAAQVMHIALTVDWFIEGAFGSGFDMNFEEHDRQAKACTSLEAAKAAFNKSMDRFNSIIQEKSLEELTEPFPEGAIMQGPKTGTIFGLIDHTAHHRGALVVYTRLLGKTPVMPYMDV